MEIVGIFVNRRTIARALMQDDQLESAMSPRGVRPPHPSARAACSHVRQARAFAYRRSRDEHWPVAYCEDCLTLVAGRDPLARSSKARSRRDGGKFVNARWSHDWPKRGRPRADRPPESIDWPEAA
jgi:hypothetical protein